MTTREEAKPRGCLGVYASGRITVRAYDTERPTTYHI